MDDCFHADNCTVSTTSLNNKKFCIAYHSKINGMYHRLDGPALIYYDCEGNPYTEFYYIEGLYYTKEKFDALFKGAESNEDREILLDIKIDYE